MSSKASQLAGVALRPFRAIRNALRGIRARMAGAYSRLLMRWLLAGRRGTSSPAKRVLFWVPGGMPTMLDVEGAIAAASMARGAGVSAVLCDGAYTACVRRDVRDKRPISQWSEDCRACTTACARAADRLGVPYSFIGDFVDEATRARLRELSRSVSWQALDGFSYDGIAIGKNIRSAIIRYLQGHDFPDRDELVHEYAYSGLVCAEAAKAAYAALRPDRVFMSHGVYVDWGPALHVALGMKLPVTAWMASYLRARFYFRHVEDSVRIDFHNMSERAWRRWGGQPLTPAQEAKLREFLSARYLNKISFDMKRLGDYSGNLGEIRRRYRLPEGKRVWGILAHINWDTVSDYAPMAYESFNQWIVDTVRHVSRVSDIVWLVKVHPAESWDNPDSGVERLVHKTFPRLAENVRVIAAEDNISPLEFFELIDGGVTVYGTAGLELALMGKPVICAGEAHYGRKGFTYDGLDVGAYRRLLAEAPGMMPLSDAQRTLAQRYAFTYFMRRQIPLPVVDDPATDWWRFRLDRRRSLLPGEDSFVDFICDRLLDGEDFILDDSLLAAAEAPTRS
jgi:hypothetical protein